MAQLKNKWVEDNAISENKINASIAGDGLTGGSGSPLAVFDETTAAVEIYVDPAGNDTTGDGSVGDPYLTITKAYSVVPYLLKHPVRIHIAAGTYTAFPEIIRHRCEGNGQLIFDGADGFSDDEGTLTSTTSTVQASYYGGLIPIRVSVLVSGAGWSVNEHRGKFVKILTGAQADGICVIASNTADTLILESGWHSWVDTGDTFTIGDPLAIVNSATVTYISVRNERDIADSEVSRVGFGFIDFNASVDNPMQFANTDAVVQGCKIRQTSNSNIRLADSSVNLSDLVVPGSSFTVTSTVGTYDSQFLYKGYLYVAGSNVCGAKWNTRGEIRSSGNGSSSLNCFVGGCSMQKAEILAKCFIFISLSTIEGGTSYDCAEQWESAEVIFGECYFISGKSILNLAKRSGTTMRDNLFAAASNFTRYGAELNGLNSVYIEAGAAPAGNLGDVYFYQTDTVSPAPATGVMVSDGQGSRVVNRRV